MLTAQSFGFGTQIRKSPFFDATVRWGAKAFSFYNHMYIPRDFGDPEQNFWNLVNDAILCDVAVERQVEITGPDAAKFTQYLCCRDLSTCQVGQCKYVLITDQDGVPVAPLKELGRGLPEGSHVFLLGQFGHQPIVQFLQFLSRPAAPAFHL